jgi:hypothetical protein
MDKENERGPSSGPLRILEDSEKIYVVGFGLWLEVKTREDGLALIAELEDQGFRICF